MGKRRIFLGGLSSGVLVIVFALAIIAFPVDSAIPPTPAYSTLHIANNVTWPNSTITNITAIIYNDEWILGADNSILINITNLTP